MARVPHDTSFTEKGFYLQEFRSRTLGLALSQRCSPEEAEPLRALLAELAEHRIRVVMLAAEDPLPRAGFAHLRADRPDWVSGVWRAFEKSGCVHVELPADDAFPASVARVVVRLQLAKLVWIDARGAIRGDDGERISFIALEQLADFAKTRVSDSGLGPILEETRGMLESGLPSVSLCSVEGLAGELFTYAGSGTFFARERYTTVRALALDEFDAANALIARGVEEGYLFARPREEQDAILAHAFGVFVEGRFLAGLGALLPHEDAGVAEVSSLYTLTRFIGEGVGDHLVRFARERAREMGLAAVFACTTSERVERFFVRNGFERVHADRLPVSKWRGYPADRRGRLYCLWSDL